MQTWLLKAACWTRWTPPTYPVTTQFIKKEPGLFSDEVDVDVITEFCALRAKTYAFNIYAGEKD